jgi:hypothetical protein
MAVTKNAPRLNPGLIARKGEAAPTLNIPGAPPVSAERPEPKKPVEEETLTAIKKPEPTVGRAGKKMSITMSPDLDRALSLRAIERGTSKLVLVYEALQQAGYPIADEMLLAWRRK